MARPSPRMVVMFAEKMETDVKTVKRRNAVNEPRMPMAPMANGSPAAVRLPKIKRSSTSRMGKDRLSASFMSLVVWVLIASSVGTRPPTLVRRPGAARSDFMAS
jgi:hypothetical protein